MQRYRGVWVTQQRLSQHELLFTDSDFERICCLLRTLAGISLHPVHKALVYSRLACRLRTLNLQDFQAYLELLEGPMGGREQDQFVNALTTNLTAFFREPHHFDFFCSTVMPEAMRAHAGDQRIRLWSAGCSTGEEPYTMAMLAAEGLDSAGQWDLNILATDLDSSALSVAQRGEYDRERLSGMDIERVMKWFEAVEGDRERLLRIRPRLRRLVTFKQLNLLRDRQPDSGFDAIFCRNVMIYFDRPSRQQLCERYADCLNAGGYLFVGQSESLNELSERFEPVARTIYRKIG
jgi:chemotaxis protein methyltransferase CheR